MITTAKDFEMLKEHVGHKIICVMYGDNTEASIECEKCNEVLYSVKRHEEMTLSDIEHLITSNLPPTTERSKELLNAYLASIGIEITSKK